MVVFCCLLFIVLHCVALWNNFPHHVLVHLNAMQCCLRCLMGLFELQFVHRGCFCVCCCCWLSGVGGCFLHCVALWNSFPHHVLVHLIALQCCMRCLVGLSELQFVHRGCMRLLFFLF